MDIGQVNVGPEPTAIIGGRFDKEVRVANIGHARVWIGASDIAPGDGFPLSPGESQTFGGGEGLYAVRYPGPDTVAIVAFSAS